MKIKKKGIELFGSKTDGYVLRFPPTQTPNDVHATFEDLCEFHKLFGAYLKSVKQLKKKHENK